MKLLLRRTLVHSDYNASFTEAKILTTEIKGASEYNQQLCICCIILFSTRVRRKNA